MLLSHTTIISKSISNLLLQMPLKALFSLIKEIIDMYWKFFLLHFIIDWKQLQLVYKISITLAMKFKNTQ